MNMQTGETRSLEGCRILIVEDEYFQAREVSVTLSRAGAQVVGPTGRAEDVPKLLEEGPVDLAMLDINLGNGASFDIARRMQEEKVPFLFLTGYDVSIIPEDLSEPPRLEKPVDQERLIERLASLIDKRGC